jgi:HSP20 family protein
MPQMDDWQREVERYLAHFAHAKRPTILFTQHPQLTPTWTPSLDMYETDDAVVVLLELAGVDPNQAEIRAEPHRLLVRGVRRERHGPAGPAGRTYHALEIPYGRFERSLPLPPGLDTEAARASYQEGLLEITLPKRAPTQVHIAVEPARSSSTGAEREA